MIILYYQTDYKKLEIDSLLKSFKICLSLEDLSWNYRYFFHMEIQTIHL